MHPLRKKVPALSQTQLIVALSLFIAVFHNLGFFQLFQTTYSGNEKLYLLTLLVGIFHTGIVVIMFSVLGVNRLFRYLAILLVFISAATAYFIDTYQVIIDRTMIINILETHPAEAMDLLSLRLVYYILLLAVVPALFIWRATQFKEKLVSALLKRLILIAISLTVILGSVFIESDFFASFLREQAALKKHTNPTTMIDSVIKISKDAFTQKQNRTFEIISSNNKQKSHSNKPRLFIFVLGETARADHFSLNGYTRNTNPELSTQQVVSFQNFYSCGTTTADSVPCMFSNMNRDNYNRSNALHRQNILDILKDAGVSVLWRDNNSGSKGVADRVMFENFSLASDNHACAGECRDTGLLDNINAWVKQQSQNDMLIVLHQMGSHGPAYYKRYPDEFKRFTPTCNTNMLNECEQAAIVNTYDNTILYTDYFLSATIKWLKQHSRDYDAGFWYISDHGESLGENGLYLHGMPYNLSPDAQKHVPSILWQADFDKTGAPQKFRNLQTSALSHDNIFHSLLGLFDVETPVYDRQLDIFNSDTATAGE